jgi:hypothetical protein
VDERQRRTAARRLAERDRQTRVVRGVGDPLGADEAPAQDDPPARV